MTKAVYERVRQQAGPRCGYCRTSSVITGERHTIEYIVPKARGGSDEEDNLWSSCRRCNQYKRDLLQAVDPVSGVLTPLYNPRTQIWRDHFTWSGDGAHIVGVTACGRATVAALQLNHIDIVNARRIWMSVGWHPPQE